MWEWLLKLVWKFDGLESGDPNPNPNAGCPPHWTWVAVPRLLYGCVQPTRYVARVVHCSAAGDIHIAWRDPQLGPPECLPPGQTFDVLGDEDPGVNELYESYSEARRRSFEGDAEVSARRAKRAAEVRDGELLSLWLQFFAGVWNRALLHSFARNEKVHGFITALRGNNGTTLMLKDVCNKIANEAPKLPAAAALGFEQVEELACASPALEALVRKIKYYPFLVYIIVKPRVNKLINIKVLC